jgi:hypothetical protein
MQTFPQRQAINWRTYCLFLLFEMSLKCPAGIDNGARLRVKGEGNAGRRGAPPGDLIVFIRVKDHSELRREGIDIHSDIEISYVDAILGSLVSVILLHVMLISVIVSFVVLLDGVTCLQSVAHASSLFITASVAHDISLHLALSHI